MNKKLISVVVPIYNSEKFLRKCLESILNQSFLNYELLLINDGSTDSSLEICEEYYKKNKEKIRLYSNQNQGCSASRNFGISKATGKYIIFIDSDDWIEPNMLESMYNKALEEHSDIVISGAYFEYKNEKIELEIIPTKENKDYFWFTDKNLVSFACFKMYSLDLIRQNNIKFPINLRLAEDFVFNVEVSLKTKNISILPFSFYHYIFYGANSVYNISNRKDIFVAQDMIYQNLVENKLLENTILSKLVQQCFKNHIKSGFAKLIYARKTEEFNTNYKIFKEKTKEAKYLTETDKKEIFKRGYFIRLFYFVHFRSIFSFRLKLLKIKRILTGK